MASLGKSIGGLTATLMGGRPPKLPPLPGDLGLPGKSTIPTYREKAGNVLSAPEYQAQLAKANNYNQALVQLLNQQPHLTGAQRSEIYKYYGDDMSNAQLPVYKGLQKKYGGITDFSGQISQMTPDQFAAQQQQQATAQQAAVSPPAAPAQQALAPAPAPQQQTQAPQTVGPTTKPVEQPVATPVVATPGGNIAGKTTTTGGTESNSSGSSRGRRGRLATLLTGLGGALERFGS